MKILVPVDGSPHSNAAVEFLALRATLISQEPDVQLLNVEPTIPVRVARALGREEVRRYQRAQADAVLRPALARLKKAGLRVRANVAVSNRSDAIAAVAARKKSDLIVMGSRGHSALKGLLFGSMTNAVLASCTKPLLVLRDRKIPRRDSLVVGIAIDGSKYGLAAVRWVLAHRELFGAEPRFELIHVLPGLPPGPVPGLTYEPEPADRPARLDAAQAAAFDKFVAPARKLFANAGVEATTIPMISSNAGDAIAAYATRRRLHMLAMGSRGYGAVKSLVMGSVATRVAARCNVPLLLLR